MRRIINACILLGLTFFCNAQDEVYFFDKSESDFKIQSMQGVELSLSTENDLFYILNDYGDMSHFSVSLNYFHENKVTSVISLYKSIGFYSNLIWSTNYNYDQPSKAYNFSTVAGIIANIEPRWYFRYKNLASMGKGRLNSGAYLSMPVSISLPMLDNYFNGFRFTPKNAFTLTAMLGLGGGYRFALSDHWLLEAQAQLYLFDYLRFQSQWRLSFAIGSSNLPFELKIKAAYKF